MMRRNFAQVLKESKIDLKNEYLKFYNFFYTKSNKTNNSIANIVAEKFVYFHFRGTCLTLKEFNETNEFKFEKYPQDFNEDYLINFMEYIYNFVVCLDNGFFGFDMRKDIFIQQILRVIDKMGYMSIVEAGVTIFVPQDNCAIAVATSELIPENLSYKVLEYNHHSLKGNIEAKRDALVKLASILEPYDKKLNEINKTFKSDLFQLLNSCNIRHNNKDKSSQHYKEYIAEMSATELEHTYDETYQMCLLAFMQLEHVDRKSWLKELKDNIDGSQDKKSN